MRRSAIATALRRLRAQSPSRLATAFGLALLCPAMAGAASVCGIDLDAVVQADDALRQNYYILSDIGCDEPSLTAHRLMCDSSYSEDRSLWLMGNLDDAAWVYAYENATGIETDHDNPPRDTEFLAARDDCTDAACLCALLISHTNDALGGNSPYHAP